MRKLTMAAILFATPLFAYSALAQQPRYSATTTPLGALLADPAAKAVLTRLFPDLVASKAVAGGYANRMTLRSLKRFRPKSFTDARLAEADTEFAKLPAR